MAKSMTGFGRGEALRPGLRISVDIRSVNSRYCDIQVRLPRTLASLEPRVRQAVADRFARGKIDVFVSIEDTRTEAQTVQYNAELARAYADALRQLTRVVGSVEEVSLSHVIGFPDVLSAEPAQIDPDAFGEQVQEALDEALNGIVAMRAAEGASLTGNILEKLDVLATERTAIEARAPQVPQEYRERLEHRIEELLGDRKDEVMDPARLAGEIALFADKCAIDEELVRLDSHLSQFRKTLNENGSIGKKLDFIVQEINREVNTIGSKANDIEVTNRVIGMKSELEKVREQIQNIE